MTNKNMPQETIERYLRNELSANELSDFTFKMVMNPTIRKEVEATRIAFKTLQTTAAPTVTSASSTGGKKLIVLAIAGILLLSIAAFFFLQKSETIEQSTPPVELIMPTKYPANVPIAQAYIRNEFIENNMGETRGMGKRVANFEITADTKTVNFSGQFIGDIQEAQVTIWNNQKKDFVEERFVFAKKIDLPADGKVDFDVNYSLEKGLYYFVVTIDEETGKIWRFEVI